MKARTEVATMSPLRPRILHRFDVSENEALDIQVKLAPLVIRQDRTPAAVRIVAGVDAAYETSSNRVFSAVVLCDAGTLRAVQTATAEGQLNFPYVPGLFSFRETPAIMSAIEKLEMDADLILCDGHGVAHPRRFGLASHIGVLYDVPAIGCAKTLLSGEAGVPGPKRGDRADILDGGEILGAVLRTQDGVKPVYVSCGHRVSLESACQWVLRTAARYRLPEPIRAANEIVNQMRARSRTVIP